MEKRRSIISTNPGNNYEVLGEVEVSTEKEISEKVSKAKQALEAWKTLGVEGRVRLLRKGVEIIKKRKEEIARLVTLEMGMTITQSRMDVDLALDFYNWYLDNAPKALAPEICFEDDNNIHRVFYEPLGVAAVIAVWNFPLSNVIWGVHQNLVVGNTVVFKHSKEIILFSKLIEEIMESSGLPDGVFNQVFGDSQVGDFLVRQDVNLICFTGSTETGRYLYKIAAEKLIRAILELGGSAPGVVFEDADIDNVLESIYFGRFLNCGQVCDGLKRLIVHESRFDEVVNKLKELLESKKVGNPLDDDTEFGPLISKQQLEILKKQVKDTIDEGAKVVSGGKVPEGLAGAYFEPTILTNITRDMTAWKEEVFGPVLPVMSFKTEGEALELANDTPYGLGSYIYTKNKNKALEFASKINAGNVNINNAYYLLPACPFGGFKDSGLGREHGKHGLQELTQMKVISIEK